MDMRRIVGDNVLRLRRARGLTQEQLSEQSGLTQTYVSQLENGLRNPTIVTLYNIATVLGVPPAQLIQPEQP